MDFLLSFASGKRLNLSYPIQTCSKFGNIQKRNTHVHGSSAEISKKHESNPAQHPVERYPNILRQTTSSAQSCCRICTVELRHLGHIKKALTNAPKQLS